MSGSSTVIAFVPGTTASELNDLFGNVWPNLVNSDLGIARRAVIATEMKNTLNLNVGNIVSAYPTSNTSSKPCYASLIQYMTTATNFESGVAFTPFTYNSTVQKKKTPVPVSDYLFYMIPYDWRHDNLTSAQWLFDALSYLDSAYKGKPYNLYLVGHSMGGLVCRGMLESGLANSSTSWWNNLQMLITLATPHLGAPLALCPMLGIDPPNVSLPANLMHFVQGFVNETIFPSTYELLPPNLPSPNQQLFIQEVPPNSATLCDIYDKSETTFQGALTTQGFDGTSLDEAAAFFGKLSYDGANMPKLYHCFVGSGLETLADAGPSNYAYSFDPTSGVITPVVAPQTGDGVVPAYSASFTTNPTVVVTSFPQYNHGQMGGSDMANYPDAVTSMLALAGVSVTTKAPALA